MPENTGLVESPNNGYHSMNGETTDQGDHNGVTGKTTQQQQQQQQQQHQHQQHHQQQATSSGNEELPESIPKKMSRRGKVVLALCTAALFLASCAYSLLGPFYTVEAQSRGITIFMVGVVFGVSELAIVITSPIFGSYMTSIGSKFTFLAGIFVAGSANILFATIIFIENEVGFFVMSLMCRCFEALGFSAYSTASFAITSTYNPNHIGFAFGILETGIGAGFVFGPVFGGIMYELGGFGLPFYSIGAMVLLNGLIMYTFLPSNDDVQSKRRESIFTLLRSPIVVLSSASVFVAMFAMAAYNSLLAKNVEEFGLSPVVLGILFADLSAVLALFSLLWGYLADRINIQYLLLVNGHFFSAIGFALLGPSVLFPFIPFDLTAVSIGLALAGMGFASLTVATMKCMTTGAFELELEDCLDTYALVSGLFMASFTLGGFIGPLFSGAIAQTYGYHAAFTAVGLCHIAVMVCVVVFLSVRRYQRGNTNNTVKTSE